MPQTTIQRGNTLYDFLITINPNTAQSALVWSGSVGATSAAEITTTIQGLQVGDVIAGATYNPPTGTAVTTAMPYGFDWTNARVSAANTLAMLWNNTTAGGLTPPTQYWTFEVMRPESPGFITSYAG